MQAGSVFVQITSTVNLGWVGNSENCRNLGAKKKQVRNYYQLTLPNAIITKNDNK